MTEDMSTIPQSSYLSILEGIVDGVVVIDRAGTILLFNAAAQKMFGYASEEVLGRNVSVLMPASYRGDHPRAIVEHLKTRQGYKVELRTRVLEGMRKNGEIFPVEISVGEVEDGEALMFVGTLRDITERNRVESELAEKRRELEQRIRFDSQGRILLSQLHGHTTAEGMLTALLESFAQLNGWRPSGVYLCDSWSPSLELTASLGVSPGELTRTLQLGEGLVGRAAEQRQVLKDEKGHPLMTLDADLGGQRPAMVVAVPVHNSDRLFGALVFASPYALDPSELEFLEDISRWLGVGLQSVGQYEEMRKLSNQLNEQSRKILEKNMQLKQASLHKSQFFANMSHELRTPLNAIIGFAEVLRDGLVGELTAEQKEYTQDIYQSGKHLLSLISDILELSKTEAGMMQLSFYEVEGQEIFANAMTMVREPAQKKGLRICRTVDESIGQLVTDGRKLRQILYNLLSNAVKFTQQGEVWLRARRRLIDGQEWLICEVEDSGAGIEANALETIWEPFQQTRTGALHPEGTGLGLALVRQFVELLGGQITLESELGRGSLFRFRIPYRPLAYQEASPISPASLNRLHTGLLPTPEPGPSAPLVLMIEDELTTASVLESYLTAWGYRVIHKTTAEEGFVEALAEGPDLILLDILLPGVDGWKLLERLKKDERTESVPVVVVSVFADEERKRGLELGAAELLQKPATPKRLLSVFSRLGMGLPEPSSPQGEEILVVDDDPIIADFVAAQLEARGFQVLRAYGGEQAIVIAQKYLPSAIILDLAMSGMDGFSVLSELRSNPATQNIPVVVLTAQDLGSEEIHSLQEGIIQLMRKTQFQSGEFLRVVRGAVRQFEHERTPASTPHPPKTSRLLVLEPASEGQSLASLLESAGFDVSPASSLTEATSALAHQDLSGVVISLWDHPGGALVIDAAGSLPVLWLEEGETSQPPPPGVDLRLSARVGLPEIVRSLRSLGMKPHREASRGRILVIDSDLHTQRLMLAESEALSCELLSALNARDGLRQLHKNQPDVVVLELLLPDMSGFDVLAQLKSRPESAEIPVFILTSKELGEEERVSLEKKVEAVFSKSSLSAAELSQSLAALIATEAP